jgi:DNA polymerase
MPLKYYGAHTGRWSGLDKVNMQNLPSRDVKKKALKNAILPPKGHVIINVDSSQIEARILVWLAGQDDVIEQFKNNEDVYSNFASRVYGKKIDKRNKTERFIGKTCILGLGYGTGWKKLQDTLKTQPPYVDVPNHEAQRYVKTYRDLNFKVTQLWKNCDKALEYLDTWETRIANGYGKPYSLDKHNSVEVSPQGLKLPNGLYIKYPELRYDTTTSQGGYVYKKRFGGEVSLWGGAVVENVVQALARIIIGEQMIRINERYKPVLTVHDAVVCVAPEEEKDEALKFIMGEMSKAPDWAPDLPITCEGEYGKSYGDC